MLSLLIAKRQKMKNRKNICYVTILLLLALVAVAVVYANSYFVIDGGTMSGDLDVFYIIGKNWANGLLPYVTAWDSKGPLIFFFNMLGFLITNDKFGVLIVESINFTLVLWCSYYFLRKYCSLRHCAVCLIAFLGNYIAISSGGNQVGCYTLMLSVITTFLTYRWSLNFQAGKVEHPYCNSIVYGLMFAGCVLSRLSNAFLLCASVLAIMAVLIYHKKWKNLLTNAAAFIAGFAILYVPFAGYFAYHNAFHDMWYASVLYNLEYAGSSSPVGVTNANHPIVKFVFYNICLLACLAVSFLGIAHRERRKIGIFWCFTSIVTIYGILNSSAYANYTISFLPTVFIAFIELIKLFKSHGRALYKWAYVGILLIAVAAAVDYWRVLGDFYEVEKATKRKVALAQLNMINTFVGHDSFSLYNGGYLIYFNNDEYPYYRFWMLQDWAIDKGPSLCSKVIECYETGDAKWIIVHNFEHCHIHDILSRRYAIVKYDAANNLTLFKLREEETKTKL